MLFNKKSFLSVVVLILLPVFVWSQSPSHTQTGPFGQQLLIEQSPQTHAPQHIWGVNAPLSTISHSFSELTQGNAAGIGKQFLSHFTPILGIAPGELQAMLVRHSSRNQWHLKYQQYYQHIPVWQSYVAVTIEPMGHIRNIHSRIYPDITVNPTPTLSSTDAEVIVQSDTSFSSGDSSWVAGDPTLLIYPDVGDTVTYRLVWEVRRLTAGPPTDLSVFVDASTGSIVHTFSNLRDAYNYGYARRGYFPQHYDDTPVTGGNLQNVNVEIRGISYLGGDYLIAEDNTSSNGLYQISWSPNNSFYSSYYIKGTKSLELSNTYANIQNANTAHNTYYFTPSSQYYHNWMWTTDETNVYYHMNVIHNYFHDTQGYNGIDYQMKGYVHQGSSINGKADGTDIYFGSDNSQEWAKSSDVVYHEYTHNVIYHLYNGFIGDWPRYGPWGEDEAMDEGLADYYACTMNDNHIQGESVGVDRNLDNDRVFDSYPYADPHWNGTVIGGAVWNMHETGSIGPALADALLFGALEYADAYTFAHLLTNVIKTDDAMSGNGDPSNGSPHLDAILQAFYNHEIYPSDPDIPPRAPVNISVSSQSGHPYIQWDANPESDLDGYNVYRLPESEDTPKKVNTSLITSTQFTDTGMDVGTTDECEYWVKAVDQQGSISSASDIVTILTKPMKQKGSDQKIVELIPGKYYLAPNHPNPFNPSTTIHYQLPEPSSVRITVYNIMGQRVRTLVQSSVPAGYQSVTWDGTTEQGNHAASGTYFLRAEFHSLASEATFTKITKMLLLR